MKIETSRFGPLEVDETRVITFEKGILGFPDSTEYALVETGESSGFYWLQAVQRADLAFVVCDPRLFVPDYRAPVKVEELNRASEFYAAALRNPRAHKFIQDDPERALEFIAFIGLPAK